VGGREYDGRVAASLPSSLTLKADKSNAQLAAADILRIEEPCCRGAHAGIGAIAGFLTAARLAALSAPRTCHGDCLNRRDAGVLDGAAGLLLGAALGASVEGRRTILDRSRAAHASIVPAPTFTGVAFLAGLRW